MRTVVGPAKTRGQHFVRLRRSKAVSAPASLTAMNGARSWRDVDHGLSQMTALLLPCLANPVMTPTKVPSARNSTSVLAIGISDRGIRKAAAIVGVAALRFIPLATRICREQLAVSSGECQSPCAAQFANREHRQFPASFMSLTAAASRQPAPADDRTREIARDPR